MDLLEKKILNIINGLLARLYIASSYKQIRKLFEKDINEFFLEKIDFSLSGKKIIYIKKSK